METTIRFHKFQLLALKSTARFLGLFAGWQSGKSTAGILVFFYRIDLQVDIWKAEAKRLKLEHPEKLSRPTFAILTRSEADFTTVVLPKIKELIPASKFTYKKSEKVIEMTSGAVIHIRSAFNPDAIEGLTLNGIYADEARYFDASIWEKMQARVATRNGFIILTSTPSQGWLNDEFYEVWKAGKDKSFDCIQWTSLDNPAFSKEEYYRQKSRLPSEMFEMLYEGKFTELSGLVYGKLKETEHFVSSVPLQFDVVIGGIDWGYATQCAVMIIGIVAGVYYVLDEFCESRVELPNLINIILEKQERYKVKRFYADPSEPDSIEKARLSGVKLGKTDRDVQAGITTIQGLISHSKFFIYDRCIITKTDMLKYAYQTNSAGLYIDSVVKLHDHPNDAIRYAIQSFKYHEVDFNERIMVDLEERVRKQEIEFKTRWGHPDFYKELGQMQSKQNVYYRPENYD